MNLLELNSWIKIIIKINQKKSNKKLKNKLKIIRILNYQKSKRKNKKDFNNNNNKKIIKINLTLKNLIQYYLFLKGFLKIIILIFNYYSVLTKSYYNFG